MTINGCSMGLCRSVESPHLKEEAPKIQEKEEFCSVPTSEPADKTTESKEQEEEAPGDSMWEHNLVVLFESARHIMPLALRLCKASA